MYNRHCPCDPLLTRPYWLSGCYKPLIPLTVPPLATDKFTKMMFFKNFGWFYVHGNYLIFWSPVGNEHFHGILYKSGMVHFLDLLSNGGFLLTMLTFLICS